MQEDKFELLARGSNTELVLYEQLVLKMVDVQYGKHARHLHNQHSIMKLLDHPHVLVCLGLRRHVKFTDEKLGIKGTRDVLLLEHATQGSLLQYLKKNRLEAATKLTLLRQLCEALYYLHITQRVAHRDIKLDNLLLTKDSKGGLKLLLSDFGFAIKGDPERPDLLAHSCKGTRRGYMPPELHLQVQNKEYQATKLDIFSLGVVIFALMFNKLPFEFATAADKHYSLLMENRAEEFWKKHNISEEAWNQVGLREELKQLLQQMWQFRPKDRPTISQVKCSAWLNYSFQ